MKDEKMKELQQKKDEAEKIIMRDLTLAEIGYLTTHSLREFIYDYLKLSAWDTEVLKTIRSAIANKCTTPVQEYEDDALEFVENQEMIKSASRVLFEISKSLLGIDNTASIERLKELDHYSFLKLGYKNQAIQTKAIINFDNRPGGFDFETDSDINIDSIHSILSVGEWNNYFDRLPQELVERRVTQIKTDEDFGDLIDDCKDMIIKSLKESVLREGELSIPETEVREEVYASFMKDDMNDRLIINDNIIKYN